MICRTCGSTAEPALISKSMASALSDLPERIWLALGLFDRCADCFWWRLALLLGYCVL